MPQIRPSWRKAFKRAQGAGVDFSVSPVHEVADDVEDPEEPTSLEPLVTGVTTEYATSELITNALGDLITAGV